MHRLQAIQTTFRWYVFEGMGTLEEETIDKCIKQSKGDLNIVDVHIIFVFLLRTFILFSGS